MKVFGRRVEWRRLAAHMGLLTLASAVLSLPTFAAAGGQALPWEAPLTRLQQSLSGPVAGAPLIISPVAVGASALFGGALGVIGFLERCVVCVGAFSQSAQALA